MGSYFGEFVGSCLLIVFGNGVVANVLLNASKGKHGGWIVIAFGWAMGVFIAVYIAAPSSGAHLNPAVSLGLAMAGKFSWSQLPAYVAAQVSGAATGAMLVWAVYRDHFNQTDNKDEILACYCTAPAIYNPLQNLFVEAFATFVLIMGIFHLTASSQSLGSLDALPVALLVLGLGLSLGGPTGYAINPARDLGPRIAHFILPMKYKGSSEWHYAWVPVVGPLLGASAAIIFYLSYN
ncbi:MAG: aquaporin family protein [Saprospiraceae bacterium]|nr:aquaporin family protein [Saprospiraceae bacterium]